MIGLHPGCFGCVLLFFAILVLTNIVAACMCMTIGAAVPSNAVANVAGSLATLVAALFGGPFINRANAPAYLAPALGLSYINFAYGEEGGSRMPPPSPPSRPSPRRRR